MSETDSFIQEVSEEVRQDRMNALLKKWAPVILGGVAIVVGGAAYWSWTEAEKQAAAEMRGAAFLSADPEVLVEQTELPQIVDGPAQLIAEFTAAAALVRNGQIDAATIAYEAIAAKPGIDPGYADLASLRVASLLRNRLALAPLIEADRPYRLLALELRAALAIQAGEIAPAHEDLRVILADPQATVGLRQRAQALLTATGGDTGDASG